MDAYILICALMVLCCLNLTDQRSFRAKRAALHVPPSNKPTFLRDAVERPPGSSFADKSASYKEEFGSKALPLRTAVESVPDAIHSSRRLPLRDAVEKRPPPDEVEEIFEFRKGTSNVDQHSQNVAPGFFPAPIRTPYVPLGVFQNVVGLHSQTYRFVDAPGILVYQADGERNFYGNSPFFRSETVLKKREGKLHPYEPIGHPDKKVVCYVDGSAVRRKEPMPFVPSDLDASACTHVIYTFATINPVDFTVEPIDKEYEVIQGGYRSFTQLKNKNRDLKLLISIVGDRGAAGRRLFGDLVQTQTRRFNFIKSLVSFMKLYGFDGVDLHLPTLDYSGGGAIDDRNFALFLEDLNRTLKLGDYLLTVTVSSSRSKIGDDFLITVLENTVDFVNLQTYDFDWERDGADGHDDSSTRPDRKNFVGFQNDVDFAVSHWLQRGISAQKIILGVPFYGKSFTLQDDNNTTIGAPIKGPGREGYYTQKAGLLANFEICDMILNDGWREMHDSTGSPYAVNKDQWINGYETPASTKEKVLYVKEKNLGGVHAWTVDLDDFKGLCGVKWPLLNSITWHLNGKMISPGNGKLAAPSGECDTDGLYNDPKHCAHYKVCRGGFGHKMKCAGSSLFNPKTGNCEHIDHGLCRPGQIVFLPARRRELNRILKTGKLVREKPKVVCYFTNWAFYRKNGGKFVPENVDQRLCTHVVYAFASLDPDALLLKEFDPWADLDNNLYQRVTALPGTTVMLALGGWTDSAGDKYSRLIGDGTARRKFIVGVVGFLKKHGFRGLHLDWNYPVCWQSNCKKGPASDKNNFNKLVLALKEEFNKESPALVLAAAISGYKEIIDAAYNIRVISQSLDFMSVMTYDYHGSWERQTGHVSPLNSAPGDKYPQYNTNFTMDYLVRLGAPREKLVVGIPFYGQTFTLAKGNDGHQTGVAATGPGTPGEYTNQPGMLSFYEVCNRVRYQRWNVDRDLHASSGPHAYYKNQWVGYDDVQSVEEKAKFIEFSGYGGAAAWTIDLDDFNNECCQGSFPLLQAINRGLGRLIGKVQNDCAKPPPPVTPPAPILTTGVDSGAASVTTPISPDWSETTTHKVTTTTTWKPTDTPTTTTTTRKTTTEPWSQPDVTTRPPPAIVMPEVGQKPPTKCETGQYYPHLQNCNAYYRCILGDLKKQYCAGSLHWNKDRGICDWPQNAHCTEENSTTNGTPGDNDSATTTFKPTTTRRTTTSTQHHWQTTFETTTAYHHPSPVVTTVKPTTASLENCDNGQYYPHEECHKFYVCVNGQLVSQLCAPGLVWNEQHSMCDWRHAIDCGSRRTFGQTNNKLVVQRIGYKPYSSCNVGSFAAYEGDCSQYLICLWGKFESFNCAQGLHWNDDKKICDWPSNARCTDSNTGTIDTDEGTLGVPEGPFNEIQPPEQGKPPTTQKPVTAVTTETPHEPLPPLSGYFKIVCYFTNWAWYRRGIGKYTPEDINADLCTHIVYGFAVLDYENLIIKAHDSWADFDNRFYERVVEYKNKGKKVSLALGGWNDSQGDKYSRLVNNPSARARFVKHALEFLEKYNFDGLDLDWEYPKCWQVDCKKGPDSDKAAFAEFTTELREAFKPKGLLLSSAVSPSKIVIDAGYDVPTIAKNLDWIAVMTYDFHGQWDKQTGHVAPLYVHPEDEVAFYNSNFSINYWISEGVPRRKIVMGMPLYGQSFQLEKESDNGLNAKAPGPGQAGEFTRAAGFLAYYEICDKVRNHGWKVVQDPKRRMGPYAYKGNQWVSYDDREMIHIKSEYIRKMDLGGGMIWALDLDDFRNRCGEGRHPLLTTIRKLLANPGNGGFEAVEEDIQEPTYVEEQLIPQSTTVSPLVDKNSQFKVVCYFTNWAWYRQGIGKYVPSDIDPDLCTHIVYGFAVLDRDQLIIKPHDTWADFDNKFYEKVTAYKAKGIKVLIAIGGWNDSAGDKYSKLANSPSARRRFINHIVEFIETHNFDGLDLDWEYPKCWQVDCNKGPSSDKPAFASLVEELHHEFRPKGWLLSSAVSPSRRVIDAGYDVPALSKYLDWIAVMCYDYHGQWDKVTGHVAPMYAHPEDIDATFNTNFTINYWIELGADRKKLVMGMPMYGQSFSLAYNQEHGLNAPTYGGGEAGEETRARGFLSYYEICTNIKKRGWTVVRDRKGRIGPYAYLKDQWVSFDDVAMIQHKSEYIKAMGLGGGMIWALDLDDFKNICGCEEYPLLKTINRALRGYTVPAPRCILEQATMKPVKKPTTQKPSILKPTYEPITQKPPFATPPEISCNGHLFVEDKTNCNQYYLCNQGMLLLQACPDGLYWNKDHCDWPEHAPCHPDGTTTAPEVTEEPEIAEQLPEITTTTRRPSYPGTTAESAVGGYKVICYFTNWAWYRQGEGKYLPSDIDPNLCTHINYGFAVLDSTSLTIKPHDSWADIDNEFYKKVTALQAKGIKVLIALGGWNDSLGDKYSRLVNNPQARARFVDQVSQFIEKWGFDGLDLDWEYPKCWQVDCNQGPDSDKEGFSNLVMELSGAFKPRGWLLSSAVSPSKAVIDAGYDVPTLSRYFDWIAVMTYDYHGQWDKKTGHVAPLYYYPGDDYDYFNSNFTLNYWIQQGAHPSKLVMGMPLYGQSFSLADASEHGLNAKSYGPGEAGEFTRAGGFLAFYEICDRVNRRSWTVVRDPQGRIGPYAYSGNQWVSYDDVAEIRRKSRLVKDLKLGGGMVWALDLDDFRNRCGCGKHPLLKTMNNELRDVPLEGNVENCT